MKKIPPYNQMLIPTLKALKLLGGSGAIDEINAKVYEVTNYSAEILEILHDENGVQTEVEYRLAWARTYLKKYGLIENSSRGVWALIDNELDISKLSETKIVKSVQAQTKKNNSDTNIENLDKKEVLEQKMDENTNWQEELISVLLQIHPSAFERLCQRILRESGFVQVEVTGKSGDGGIDGKGVIRLNGLLSLHVFFQCKRYKGSVGAGDMRDFRGAVQGRADKGLFITTGNFTQAAVQEATRDGVPPIDLIDGEMLCEKLKEFSLGIETQIIEQVIINPDWFLKF